MSEDRHIDYSESSLDELEEQRPPTPRVDIHSAGYTPPEISTLSFGPRCPACGWMKPLIMVGTGFGQPFKCRDCGSHLNLTKTHRRLNAVLWALFIPLFLWFSFSGLGRSEKLTIVALSIFLAFLELWFTRLELIDLKGDS